MRATNFHLERYQITNLNKPKTRALSLLSLTDKTNFVKRREQIIYTMLDIAKGTEIKQRSRRKIIKGIISSKLINGLKPLTAEEDSNHLTDELLEQKMSPYEVVGFIKEMSPETSAKEMTKLWTSLSIITGIKSLGDQSLKVDWQAEINQKSISPKLTNLAKSLEEDQNNKDLPVDVTRIKKKYFENKSHLKSSIGENTNWSEILANLPNDQAGLLKAMLESSKDNILKEQATKQYLWPSPSPPEIENKRLNNLLETLGNRPTGRSQRYSRILLNESPEKLPKNIPIPPEAIPTELEKSKESSFLKELEKYKSLPNHAEEKKKPWYGLFFKLGKIKKIPTQTAKAGYEEGNKIMEHFVEENVRNEFKETMLNSSKGFGKSIFYKKVLNTPKALSSKLVELFLNSKSPDSMKKLAISLLAYQKNNEKPYSNKVIVDAIQELCTMDKPPKDFNSLILQLLSRLENPSEYRRLFSEYPFTKSIALKQVVQQNICPENSTISIPSRFKDIIDSNLQNKPIELGKTYGEGKLCSLHLASWYAGKYGENTGAELTAIIEKRLEEGFNLDPKDLEGNTPLHHSSPYATKELLKYGANPRITNKQGESPIETNVYPETKDLITQETAKRATLKKLNQALELEF